MSFDGLNHVRGYCIVCSPATMFYSVYQVADFEVVGLSYPDHKKDNNQRTVGLDDLMLKVL